MSDFNIDDLVTKKNVNIAPSAAQETNPASVSHSNDVIPLVSGDKQTESSNSDKISEEKKQEISEQAETVRQEREKNNNLEVEDIKKMKEESASLEEESKFREANEKYSKIIFSKNYSKEERMLKIMDKFLQSSDETYRNLTTEEEKINYAKQAVAELAQKIGSDNGDKSLDAMNVITLIVCSDAKGISYQDVLKLENTQIKSEIENIQKKQIEEIISNINKDKPEESMKQLAEKIILLSGDEKYAKLKEEDKQKYIDDKIDEFLTNNLGLSGWKSTDREGKNTLFLLTASVVNEIVKENGIKGLTGFKKSNEFERAEFICNFLTEHPEVMNSDKSKNLEILNKELTANTKIYRQLKNEVGDKQITTKMYYDYLVKLNKEGKLDNSGQTILKQYNYLIKHGVIKKEDFDKAPRIIGNYIEAKMTCNGDLDKLFKSKLKDITKAELYQKKGEDIILEIIARASVDGDVNQIDKKLRNTLKTLYNMTNEEIDKYYKDKGLEEFTLACMSRSLGRGDADGVINVTNCKLPKNDKVICGIIEKEAPEALGADGSAKVIAYVEGDFGKAIAKGVNNYYDPYTAAKIFTDATKYDISDAQKQTIVTNSYETTEDKNRTKRLTDAYKIQKDPAITAAMAAVAKNSTDPETKKIIDEGVEFAKQNNGYSQEEIENIETARKTGQTTAQKEAAQTNSKEGTSKTTTKSKKDVTTETTSSTTDKKTSTAKTTASTNTKSNPTTTTNAKTTTSSANAANTFSNTNVINNAATAAQRAAEIAKIQLNQQIIQQITSELEAKKEITLQRITDMIDKYQKSVQEREERKEKLEAQATEATKSAQANAAEQAKNEDAVIAAAKSPQTTEEEAKKAIDQAVQSSGGFSQNFIATIKTNLTEEQAKTLSSASSDAAVYQALGSIDTGYQAKFLSDFAVHASSSALCTFASEHIGDKTLLKTLFEKSQDPALLQYLGETAAFDLLGKGKIQLKDFLRFASADTVAKYIRQMQQEGNIGAIKQITDLMSLEQSEQLAELTEDLNEYISGAQDKSDKKNEPLPGSDEWLKAQQTKMASASTVDISKNISAPDSGMLSLEDEFDGLPLSSNRVRMGIDIKKRDKRFYRIG